MKLSSLQTKKTSDIAVIGLSCFFAVLLFYIQLAFDFRGGDFRRARQVNHLAALVLQKIKLALPVITDDKGIYMVFMHIRLFLIPVFFRDDQIHIADGFNQLLAFLIGEIAFFLFFIPVEFICGNGHNQIIAQCLGTAQQVNMSIMEQIKGSLGNHAFHRSKNSFP